MKSFIISLFIISSFILASCTKTEIKENLSLKISDIAATSLSKELECSKSDLVAKDIKELTDKIFKIEEIKAIETETISITSGASVSSDEVKADLSTKVIVCKTVVSALFPSIMSLAKSGKLTEWGCTVEKGEIALLDVIYSGCEKLSK